MFLSHLPTPLTLFRTPAQVQAYTVDGVWGSTATSKNWEKVKAGVAPGMVYDEVGTHRKVEGVDNVLAVWKGWATAMPDSKATFHSEVASGNTVVLEMTWRGTHKGPLKMPTGDIPATGKNFELRACQVIEVANDKVKSVRQYFDMGSLLRQLGLEH